LSGSEVLMKAVRRTLLATVVAALAAALVGSQLTATAAPAVVLKFDTMAPVTGPYVGAANPIRGVPGGGKAWQLDSAMGLLERDGHVLVHVRGLVLVATGANPIPDFKAIVSCQTITDGAATVTNVMTEGFTATSGGDANIDAMVALPSPCIAPIVFVTSPGGAWFAATGV
jgi:hypothetical protein